MNFMNLKKCETYYLATIEGGNREIVFSVKNVENNGH
jgi:hypothetical protein